MAWDPPVVSRQQLVLFSERLDEVLPEDHSVRRLVEILDRIDWSEWESEYQHEGVGRPPIHPRVMSGVILYGLMRRIRSSRQLEEALEMRLDFRWLAEGRSIDHTTLCRFRRCHAGRLKDLFVQIVLVARCAGILSLTELAFDGTRIRANNRRSGKYEVKELKRLRKQLQEKFEEHMRLADGLDEEQVTDRGKAKDVGDSLKSRLREIERALDEVNRLSEKNESLPTRIPTTDTNSRITPSKTGGFAPNYTPLAMVDVDSGLIVSADVIATTDETSRLPAALDEVQENFDVKPERVLADAIFNQGTNLAEMEAREIELYCPLPQAENNPAIREDVTKPVPAAEWDQLPTRKTKTGEQLAKEAFVYDSEQDIYRCPQGKVLTYSSSYNNKLANGKTTKRRRYHASPADCAKCPLLARCVTGKSSFRRIAHDEYEPHRSRLAKRMKAKEAHEIYHRRMQCERPFAVIKHLMGARQFLLRGLSNVTQEWLWLATAFNLMCLITTQLPRPGPQT